MRKGVPNGLHCIRHVTACIFRLHCFIMQHEEVRKEKVALYLAQHERELGGHTDAKWEKMGSLLCIATQYAKARRMVALYCDATWERALRSCTELRHNTRKGLERLYCIATQHVKGRWEVALYCDTTRERAFWGSNIRTCVWRLHCIVCNIRKSVGRLHDIDECNIIKRLGTLQCIATYHKKGHTGQSGLGLHCPHIPIKSQSPLVIANSLISNNRLSRSDKSGPCFNMEIQQHATKYYGKEEKLLPRRSNFSSFP